MYCQFKKGNLVFEASRFMKSALTFVFRLFMIGKS